MRKAMTKILCLVSSGSPKLQAKEMVWCLESTTNVDALGIEVGPNAANQKSIPKSGVLPHMALYWEYFASIDKLDIFLSN